MTIQRRWFFVAAFVLTAVFAYSCVSHAAKRAGAYWSGFDSEDGSGADIESGYVVVDAIDARNGSSIFDGIGPFRGNGPSFSDTDVIFEEESDRPKGDSEGENVPKPEESLHWKEITVEGGDTLSKISDQNGIAIKDIMTVNELTDQHKLREGQNLYIPVSSDYVPEALAHVKKLKEEALARRKRAEPVKVTNYVVKNGDTLWSVANAFDLDVNSLFGSNKISDTDILKVGTTIRVPNQDGIFITAGSGQTLDKLAKDYGIFKEAILSANEMTNDESIVKGREIFLPGAKVMAFVETANGRKAVVKEKVTAKRGFGWPVVGKISSPFGWRRDPVRGGRDFHTGLDIRAPRGRPIVATAAGKVVHAGWMGGYGRTIVISHPGNVTTLYGHCSKLLVKAGTNVRRGDRIALVGSTGRSTGNHLHFEVRRGGAPTNPLKVLR
jgi:murein DD-endopeptidase MepM/ murein hydrolase activator NlpD